LLLIGAINRAVCGFAAVIAGVGFGLVFDETRFAYQRQQLLFSMLRPGPILL